MNQIKSESKYYFPNPFEIAIFLCVVVILLATVFAEGHLIENVNHWGSGMWGLLAFTTQIAMILVGGYVLASSRPVQNTLRRIAGLPKTPSQAYLATFLISALACWLNWGLGLITGAFLSIEMAKRMRPVNFPLLVASAYMGFLFWHGGLSGSIPLVVSTEGNFSQKFVGTTIGVEETLFSSLNFGIIFSLLVALSFLIYRLGRQSSFFHLRDWSTHFQSDEVLNFEADQTTSFSSKPAWFVILVLMGCYMGAQIYTGPLRLGMNQVNFLLMFMGVLCHGSLESFSHSATKACQRLAPIIIQYPLYAGIMTVMVESGLAVKMSDYFVAISTVKSYSSLMFLSAGVVNFFVPSGGGQWAVQAAVVTEGARQLGVSMPRTIMAVAWGDAWTNLAQPFWALPLLSIAGLELKEILGYCLKALLVSGVVVVLFFSFF